MAILASGLFVIFNPLTQIKKAYNAIRYTDLHNISNALEVYYIDHRCYPASLDQLAIGGVYLKTIPKDPETKTDYPYEVYGECPQWNILYAKFFKKALVPGTSVCPLPLASDPSCYPVNYYQGVESKWGCNILGNTDCVQVKTFVLPDDGSGGGSSPTPTPTLIPTPTCLPQNAAYSCTGGDEEAPQQCNFVGAGSGTYCSATCNGDCPGAP